MTIKDKVALVSGASRGIGAAIADQLGAAGAIVIGTATSEAGAERISARLKEQGLAGAGMVLDVTSADSVAEVLAQIKAQFGEPAIVVNNAGITQDNLLMRMSDAEWSQVIETNLSSAFRLSKRWFGGRRKAGRGGIMNFVR